MKLFTHNMLTSKMIKNVKTGYPLKLRATEVKTTTVNFHPSFTSKIVPKVDWNVLVEALKNIGHPDVIPPVPVDDYDKNEEFLKKAHHALMEIEVITGEMECPETGRKFLIQNGIPNMLVNEDEV